ncbi:MAG: PHP domain-containing protein [Candidatus Omnitrophota bacterium]
MIQQRTADLHIHSCFSDGTDTPEEIVALAAAKQLSAVAITDHDAIEGLSEAKAAGERHQVEVLAGIELSAEAQKREIHILGYAFDPQNQQLLGHLNRFREIRRERGREMIKKLRALGLSRLDFDEMEQQLGADQALGRPHVAAMLVEKGYVKTTAEAFERFIGEGGEGYVPKFKQSPREAIRVIRDAGGVAVMAHPIVTARDELIPGFAADGLQGLEVYYPRSSPAVIRYYEQLADKYDLIRTGGSDAHGRFRKYSPIGMVRVDYQAVEQIKQAAEYSGRREL